VQKELDLPSDKLKSSQTSATKFYKPISSRESTSSTSGHNLISQNYNPESSPKDFPDTSVAIKAVNVHELKHIIHESNHAVDKMKSSDDHQSIAVHKPKIKIMTYFIYNAI